MSDKDGYVSPYLRRKLRTYEQYLRDRARMRGRRPEAEVSRRDGREPPTKDARDVIADDTAAGGQ